VIAPRIAAAAEFERLSLVVIGSVNTRAFLGTNRRDELITFDCSLFGSAYNRFSQAYLRLLIGEIGGNSTKRPFRLPLDIATRLEKWI
jgi:hypothetical protein